MYACTCMNVATMNLWGTKGKYLAQTHKKKMKGIKNTQASYNNHNKKGKEIILHFG